MKQDENMLRLVSKLKLKDYKYKEPCSLFEAHITTDNGKIIQLNNWKRFFRWENTTSHTYGIIEIYDKPLLKQQIE